MIPQGRSQHNSSILCEKEKNKLLPIVLITVSLYYMV